MGLIIPLQDPKITQGLSISAVMPPKGTQKSKSGGSRDVVKEASNIIIEVKGDALRPVPFRLMAHLPKL